MRQKSKMIWQIFLSFLKIGAFTFGGGYAMIPLIQREAVENRKWVTNDDILGIVAIAESTPGPIAINAATFIGYRTAGFWGALWGTIGMVLPSFFIIFAISYVLRAFQDTPIVQYAFGGIRAGVLALMIKAFWAMYKQAPKNKASYIIMLIAFIFPVFFHVNVLVVIIICTVVGLVFSIRMKGRLDK